MGSSVVGRTRWVTVLGAEETRGDGPRGDPASKWLGALGEAEGEVEVGRGVGECFPLDLKMEETPALSMH